MPSLGGWEFVILIGILVLLFGAKRLPDMARSIGQSARVFKGEMKGLKDDGTSKDAPAQPAPPAATPPPAPLPPTAAAPPATAPQQQQETTPAAGQGHSSPGQ